MRNGFNGLVYFLGRHDIGLTGYDSYTRGDDAGILSTTTTTKKKLQEKYKADMAYWHGTVIFEYLCCVYIGEGGDYTRRIEVKMMRSAE